MAYAGKTGQLRHPRLLGNPMPRNESRRIGPVATGVALGLLFGAGLALLYAPGEGRDLRWDLQKRARRMRRKGRDVWTDLRDELAHMRG
jgi:hypothetical protein